MSFLTEEVLWLATTKYCRSDSQALETGSFLLLSPEMLTLGTQLPCCAEAQPHVGDPAESQHQLPDM